MNPTAPDGARKVLTPSNAYTIFLGISLGVLIMTTAFVAYKCLSDYGTLLPITQ
jgi:hypothetical protein